MSKVVDEEVLTISCCYLENYESYFKCLLLSCIENARNLAKSAAFGQQRITKLERETLPLGLLIPPNHIPNNRDSIDILEYSPLRDHVDHGVVENSSTTSSSTIHQQAGVGVGDQSETLC